MSVLNTTFSFVSTGTVSLISEEMEDSRKEEVTSALVPTANIFPAFYSQCVSTAKYELFLHFSVVFFRIGAVCFTSHINSCAD